METNKPVAYIIWGIDSRGFYYKHDVRFIAEGDIDEDWKWDDGCLGEYWASNTALVEIKK